MKDSQKTRLATLVPADKLEHVTKQLRGESDARIEWLIKVLSVSKVRKFRLDIDGEVQSASQGENRNGNPEIVLSINCTMNSLATRLSGGEANVDGILDDMSSGETIRRFSRPYAETLARSYDTDVDTFVLALNAFGGSYKATAKLQEEGSEWSGNGETGTFTNDWYRDESPRIKLTDRAAQWILDQKSKAKADVEKDPFDGVKAETPAEDEKMPF